MRCLQPPCRVEEWPGVHSAHALLTGEPLVGIWHDRTFARILRLRRQTPEPGQVEIPQIVVLSQLPCWKHLTPEAYRARVAELIQQIEATAAAERAKKGIEPPGSPAIGGGGPVKTATRWLRRCCSCRPQFF